jgi:hypothetical protein
MRILIDSKQCRWLADFIRVHEYGIFAYYCLGELILLERIIRGGSIDCDIDIDLPL